MQENIGKGGKIEHHLMQQSRKNKGEAWLRMSKAWGRRIGGWTSEGGGASMEEREEEEGGRMEEGQRMCG